MSEAYKEEGRGPVRVRRERSIPLSSRETQAEIATELKLQTLHVMRNSAGHLPLPFVSRCKMSIYELHLNTQRTFQAILEPLPVLTYWCVTQTLLL